MSTTLCILFTKERGEKLFAFLDDMYVWWGKDPGLEPSFRVSSKM